MLPVSSDSTTSTRRTTFWYVAVQRSRSSLLLTPGTGVPGPTTVSEGPPTSRPATAVHSPPVITPIPSPAVSLPVRASSMA